MEQTATALRAINEEVEESKEILEKLHNDIRALSDIIRPALVEHIKAIRETRMTVVREIQESLGTMRDVRKFFLESSYESEMERLDRFVKLCAELERLKANGTLDAIADVLVRVALKEVANA